MSLAAWLSLAAVSWPLVLLIHEHSHAIMARRAGWIVDHVRVWPHRKGRYDRDLRRWVFDGSWVVGHTYHHATPDTDHEDRRHAWAPYPPQIAVVLACGLLGWLVWWPLAALGAGCLVLTVYHVAALLIPGWETTDERNLKG